MVIRNFTTKRKRNENSESETESDNLSASTNSGKQTNNTTRSEFSKKI